MAAPRQRISFAVLADAHKRVDGGKIDCFGLFDTMGVWAVPAQRECSVAFGVKEVQPGQTKLRFFLRDEEGEVRELATGELSSRVRTHSVLAAERLPLPLHSVGKHQVGVSVGARPTNKNAFWVPLLVTLLPWPELPTGAELERALRDPHSIKSVRARIVCSECEKEYTLEMHLDPTKELAKGTLAFPPDGNLRCDKCGHIHFLKDIEGQLRSQLGRATTGAQS